MSAFAGQDCLDDNAVSEYVSGAMPGYLLDKARTHLTSCDGCRELVALVLPKEPASPEPGARLGRYVVLEHVGAGAMGTVFAAYDTELKRKVALKLVHPIARFRGDVEAARSRLLREAQAMAQLNHPNVVAVHDAGTSDENVFIAMEWVPGQTLWQWQTAMRSWRETLRVYLEAGQGLAAAHAAGIVHRDFKPGNVLVGEEGRVRVTDFGLARAVTEGDPAHEGGLAPESFDRLASLDRLTRTGALLGTPAYMAPEQLSGSAADAQSDQFSFCVALWEALFGARPFSGEDIRALRASMDAGLHRNPPQKSKVPARVRQALIRGLSPDPAHRFTSLGELLASLQAGTARSGVRLGLATVAIAGCAVAVFAAVSSRNNPCGAAERHLVGVWDAARRTSLQATFTASSDPLAQSAWQTVRGALDRQAEAWVRAHTEACVSTHVHGEQSAELLDARMICLERRRLELDALASALQQPGGSALRNAPQAVQALVDVSECGASNVFRGKQPPAPGSAERVRFDALLKALAETKALKDAGRYRDALERAKQTAALASKEPSARSLLAEALLLEGELHGHLSEFKESEQSLHAALPHATAAGADAIAARAWLLLTFNVGNQQSRLQEGRWYADHARAFVERAGSPPPLLATWHSFRGLLSYEEGLYEASIDHHRTALDLRTRHLGPSHRDTATSHVMLGNSLLANGDPDSALEHFRKALATREALNGPEHPSVALTINNIGAVLFEKADYDGTIEHGERARAILEKALGPDVPSLAFPIALVADAHSARSRCDKALPLYRRSLELLERSNGPDSPFLVRHLVGVGTCIPAVDASGRKEALDHLERAVKLSRSAASADARGTAHFALAKRLAQSPGGRARAQKLAATAEAAFAEMPEKLKALRDEVVAWRAREAARGK